MKNWTWRPYQNECYEAIIENYQKGITQQLIVQATGLGKRSQAVYMAGKGRNCLFLAHTEELIEQAFQDFIKWYGFMNVGMIRGKRMELDKQIVVSSPLTIVNRLDKIDPNHFDIVQLDECFIAGTMIGNTKIEDVKVGDLVTSYNHKKNVIEKRKVLSLFKNEIKGNIYKLQFSTGESFVCTENHPIFINNVGYISVNNLLYIYNKKDHGKQLSSKIFRMCCVWQTSFTTLGKQIVQVLFKRMFQSKFCIICKTYFGKLFSLWQTSRSTYQNGKGKMVYESKYLLQQRMCKNKSISNGIKSSFRNESKICFGQNEIEQSNERSGSKSKSNRKTQRKNIFKSWWKWRINKTSIANTRVNESSNGISNNGEKSNVIGKVFTKLLQGRFSLSRSKTFNRNRWENSSDEKMEVLRQTENGNTEFIRLESITLYERGSQSESAESSKENYVYNFEVERNNNYFANSILVHNCHHYMAKAYYRSASHFKCKLRLGWTATPRRLDGLSLLDLFQQKTFDFGILRGIEQGYLAELKGVRIKTNINLSGARKSMGDFNASDLEALVDIPERNKLIVDSYEKHALERQFIAFAVDTNHSLNITKTFQERGHNVAIISADESICPDRDGTIAAFKRGEYTGLINVNILTEGFDYHNVGAILDAAPTLSESRYLQRVGRGTRIKSEEFQQKFGNNCLIMDFVDLSSRHQLVNSFELDKQLPAMAKVFVTTEDRLKLFDAERKRSEAKVIKMTDKDEFFDFTKPPKVTISNSTRMMEEATEAQIKLLKWLDLYSKYDDQGNEIEYTKNTVAELLQSPIAPWMKKKMIEWKYNPEGSTMSQYLAVSKLIHTQQQQEETEAIRKENTDKMLEGLRKDAIMDNMHQLQTHRGALLRQFPEHDPKDYTDVKTLIGSDANDLPF
jgi:superfamily II DNA or RNA helicase